MDIITAYGQEVYNFLTFVITSNEMNMKDTFLLTYDQKSRAFLKDADNPVSLYKFPQFKIEHSIDEEERFRALCSEKKSCFLYHGSRMENWYSLLRNGIRIYSHEKDMCLNGAAYGEGIYLSDNLSMSLTYSRGVGSATCDRQEMIIGIYEVVGNKDCYKKATSIYVVTDEKHLLLRYILQIPNQRFVTDFRIIEQLNAKFNVEIVTEIVQKKETLSRIASKRLLSDYTKLMKAPCDGILFHLRDDSRMDLWDVYLNHFPPDSLLFADLMSYGYVHGIHLEMAFPDDYPNHPPFIRIIKPRFETFTGHVTSGGSICMELLSNQGWRPSYCLETLFVDIRNLLLVGTGRIHSVRHSEEYDIKEAKDAYQRMCATHGWY